MKTADLIPLILLELNECDKYGFELTKSIENKSHGKIIIKQPTLYTILKKLEKTKFITSYWQDSEIGGKRHYYKITDNGRMQVATLPSFDALINIIVNSNDDNVAEDDTYPATNNIETTQVIDSHGNDNISIMDSIMETNDLSPSMPIDNKVSILPSEDVFSNEHIDTATEMEINKANSSILKTEKETTEEKFATNKDVTKFIEKDNNVPISNNYRDNLAALVDEKSKNNSLDLVDLPSYDQKYEQIKYVDYIDIKKDDKYKSAKNTAKNMLYKVLSTSGYLLLLLIICAITTNFTGTSALYYIFLLIGIVCLIFYPTIYIANYEKFRLMCADGKFKNDLKKPAIIMLAIELVIIIVCIIVNINIGNNTMTELFSIHNFANLYAPLLLSTTMFIDLLFNYIFMKRLNK